jgi:hypothetical protein
VVVVTANHFWLDGVAAAVLVAAALAAQRLAQRPRSGPLLVTDAPVGISRGFRTISAENIGFGENFVHHSTHNSPQSPNDPR